jgi:hypothetical protein
LGFVTSATIHEISLYTGTFNALPRSRQYQQNSQTLLNMTNNMRSILLDEGEHIPDTMEVWLSDNRFQLRPDKPNSCSLHGLYQLHNLTTYTFTFISHNLRQPERIVSLQRMQFRLLQLPDDSHVALHGSSLEQAFEIRPIAYGKISALDENQR